MIGGKVIETIVLPDKVWVNCQDDHSTSTCAIYVARDAKSRSISEGDTVWWQSGVAMWTPTATRNTPGEKKGGVHFDIQIPRIGYSGVKRPR